MEKIIGREKEIGELKYLFESNKSEFVAIYGRMGVGKTFLIRNFFNDNFAFSVTAVSPNEGNDSPLKKRQLENFFASLVIYGSDDRQVPSDWFLAFDYLRKLLEKKRDGRKMVVFIDEIPWLDSPKSGFVSAFEHFVNSWALFQDDLLLIVSGSATSWINDKLINAKGGLYGRVTDRIHLSPFTLGECREFLKYRGITYDTYDIIMTYMILGGVPFYLEQIHPGESLAQAVDNLFFVKSPRLEGEFENLFRATFANPEHMVSVVRFLSERKYGYQRNEIIKKTGISSGGTFSKVMETLIANNFVTEYTNGYSKKETFYRLTDNFCLFCCTFSEKVKLLNHSFWQNNQNSHSTDAWKGFSFENVCFEHIDQIRDAIGIRGVSTEAYPWLFKGNDTYDGAQIDLVLERADRVVNLCEMKFVSSDYVIDKGMDMSIRNKFGIYEGVTRKRRTIQYVLVTTFGLKKNAYSGIFQRVVCGEDLFRDVRP